MANTPEEIMRKVLGESPTWPQSKDGEVKKDPLHQIALGLARLNQIAVQVGTLLAETAKIEQGRMRIEAELLSLVQTQQEASIATATQATGGFAELTKFLGPFLERALAIDQKPKVERASALPSADVPQVEHVAPSKTARLIAVSSEREVDVETDPPAEMPPVEKALRRALDESPE